MKERLFDEWLRILRDPNTKQAKFKFRDPDKENCFCALGCLVQAGINTGDIQGEWGESRLYSGSAVLLYDGCSILPRKLPVVKDVHELTARGKIRSIEDMNDNRGYSLASIADYLEENKIEVVHRDPKTNEYIK